MLEKLRSVIKTPEIEFLCHEEDYGIIPEPYSAKKLIPEWFKALPPKINNVDQLNNSTIKRCMPFLDAMSLGWVIPLAADIEFKVNDDASGVTFDSPFYKKIIETHGLQQITSEKSPNPANPKPPLKFLNYWMIKVPKGYSVLFVPPLNRPDPRFSCISGMVDCDGYFEYVNFPFFMNQPGYTGILEAGTPLVQVIPIKRNSIPKEAKIKKFEKADYKDLEATRKKRKVHESHYKDNVWVKK